MNGLTSNYYNLINETDINTNNIIVSGKFQGSNANFYYGITSNIQDQLNNNNTSTITYNSISSYFYQNVNNTIVNNYDNQNIINNNIYGSISGGFYNIINTINNNQVYNNQIYNYVTAYLNSISGNIITINNTIINNNNNNNIISNSITSLSGLLYSTINTINFNYNISNNNNNNLNNSLSGFIYNQNKINNYIFNNENSLSGLIYNSQTQIYNNKFNQNIINIAYENYLNSLQNQVTNNNKSQSQASNGNTIGSIVNGIATVGVAAGTAFLFTTVFSSLASLQSQATTESLFTQDLSLRLSALTTRVKELERQVRYLQEDVNEPLKGLLYRCELINRNTFNGDFFINGTIQQSNVNPFATNSISSNTIFYSNVQVIGILYDSSQHVTDLLQF
jgi:hypothetical protein